MIEDLRANLLILTQDIVSKIILRRDLSSSIQNLKNSFSTVSSYTHYDPKREELVFQNLLESLKSFDQKELLALSLIIESHVLHFKEGSYPQFSKREHLEEWNEELYEQINPTLLKLCMPTLFYQLSLRKEIALLLHQA